MSELGYRPSRAATTLASSRTKSIGLVIDDYRNLWFVDLLRGLESALSAHGYQVTLADSRPGENRITEATDGLLAMHVEGLVIAAEPSESMMAGTWIPAVVAGWRNDVPAGADLITNDDDGGGRMAAEHLLELGHTRIGHLSGSGGAAAHRRDGFRGRILEAGVEVRIAGESQGTSEEDGYAAACWLLDHHPDTTALFAANDTMALGAFAAAQGPRPVRAGRPVGDRLRQLPAGQVALPGHDLRRQPKRRRRRRRRERPAGADPGPRPEARAQTDRTGPHRPGHHGPHFRLIRAARAAT